MAQIVRVRADIDLLEKRLTDTELFDEILFALSNIGNVKDVEITYDGNIVSISSAKK